MSNASASIFSGELRAPAPLSITFQLNEFDSGEAVLDEWLKRKALINQAAGASRTYVTADAQQRVWGFYAIAAGAVQREHASGAVRRNMPEPVPVLVLGRLAVDRRAQGRNIGVGLLQDAVMRALQVSEQVGVRALLVHALNERARQFYLRYGFEPSPHDVMTLMLRLAGRTANA